VSEVQTPIQLLCRIKEGLLTPKSIRTGDRRLCVEHLLGEGYSTAEMAEILGVATRTILRDLSEVRASHAVKQDNKTVAEFFGNLVLQARQSTTRLKKIARNSGETGQTRIEAENASWRIERDLILVLQKAGFLPVAAQEIQADVNHRFESPTREQLLGDYQVIQQVAEEIGLPKELTLAAEGVKRDALALSPASERPCPPPTEDEEEDAA
jgi:hypothetical protein